MPTTAIIGDGAQIRPRTSGRERLLNSGRAEAAGRMEIGIDHVAIVRQDLPGRLAHCVPNLRTLDRDAEIDLVARVGIDVKSERFPTTAVLHRKAAGDDHLRENRRFFVRTTRTDLGPYDTREVVLQADPIHHYKTTAASTRRDVDAAPVTPAIGNHEPVLGDVHD